MTKANEMKAKAIAYQNEKEQKMVEMVKDYYINDLLPRIEKDASEGKMSNKYSISMLIDNWKLRDLLKNEGFELNIISMSNFQISWAK